MNRIRTNQDGVVFLELALIFPIFILVVFCSIEVSRYLTLRQANAGLGYQLANALYRECVDPFNNDKTNTCIDSQLARFQAIISQLIPVESEGPSQFRVSALSFSNSGSCRLVRSPEADNGPFSSRVVAPGSGCSFRNNFSPSVDRGPVVTVEVFTPYKPLVGGFVFSVIPGLSNLTLYSISVM